MRSRPPPELTSCKPARLIPDAMVLHLVLVNQLQHAQSLMGLPLVSVKTAKLSVLGIGLHLMPVIRSPRWLLYSSYGEIESLRRCDERLSTRTLLPSPLRPHARRRHGFSRLIEAQHHVRVSLPQSSVAIQLETGCEKLLSSVIPEKNAWVRYC